MNRDMNQTPVSTAEDYERMHDEYAKALKDAARIINLKDLALGERDARIQRLERDLDFHRRHRDAEDRICRARRNALEQQINLLERSIKSVAMAPMPSIQDQSERSRQVDNIDAIARFIVEWTPTHGDHHKVWVLDQVLRMLTGDQYHEYIAGIEWHEGVAP